jgi:hypothetical protein
MVDIIKAAQSAQNEINLLVDLLQSLRARNNFLETCIKLYEEHFGAYEDVQAQAAAPSPDLFDFTPEDVAELSAQDAQELTDDQKHATYQLQLEAEQHQAYEDLYKPYKY